MRGAWLLVLAVAGCGAARRPVAEGAWWPPPPRGEIARPASASISLPPAPLGPGRQSPSGLLEPERDAVVRIGARAEPVAVRPPRAGRTDVHLREADLTNAFRLLAESGRFQVAVGDGVQGTVTIDLRRVDPFEALRIIATAKGLDVDYTDGVVIVHARASGG